MTVRNTRIFLSWVTARSSSHILSQTPRAALFLQPLSTHISMSSHVNKYNLLCEIGCKNPAMLFGSV